MQAPILNTAPDGLAPSTFDPSLEYSTDHVVLFWQPTPIVFAVVVSYSCAEQRRMAEKARLRVRVRVRVHFVVCHRRRVIFLRGAA